MERLQKRALRSLINDYENSYEQLLEKSGKSNMKLRQLRFLCTKIYKTISSLNLDFMKKKFEMKKNNRVVRDRCKLNGIFLEQTRSRLVLIISVLVILRFGTLYPLISRQLNTLVL